MANYRLGVVMDPIQQITPKKDTSFALLLEAQNRRWDCYYFELKSLYLMNGSAYGLGYKMTVDDNPNEWYEFQSSQEIIPLHELDILLMRKDPPVDEHYIFATQMLDLAQREGCMVVNHPQTLRDANEKLFTQYFPEIIPPTLVTQNTNLLLNFVQEYQQVIFKPLTLMGGKSVFKVIAGDLNTNVIIETLSDNGKMPIMAQKYIPEVSEGDKRIILINGEPIPYVLARIPAENDFRGNLAVGGTGVVQPLSEQDKKLCEVVAPILLEKKLSLVGLDVIGNYLTEINITSPTCIREIEAATDINICGQLFDRLIQNL